MSPTPGKAPSRKWLYGPFILVGLIFAAYSAYWFYAKGQIETGLDAWIAEQRAAGAEISFASKRLHGFPYRFALTVEAPHFIAADASVDWRGETLQVAMQPWNFNHAIVRSSGRNEVLPANGQPMTALVGPKSAASFNWNDERVTDFGLTLDTVDFVGASGDISVRALTANLSDAPAPAAGSLFSLDWDAITIAETLLEGTPASSLGNEIQASRIRLAGTGFSMFTGGPERNTEIAQLLFNWGPLKFGAKGKFDVNDEGYPDGTLLVRLDDAEALRIVLDEAGLLQGEAQLLLAAIASGSNNGGFLPVPLRNGAVSIFGQAIAPIPRVAPPLSAIGAANASAE